MKLLIWLIAYFQYYQNIKTVLVPIIKDKTGDATDKSNYRPIALASVISKVLEMVILVKCEMYLHTSEHQFGFKSGHSTDLCIYTLKEVMDYYKSRSSAVHLCFMDASKAFDRVNHWTLFKKLCDRNVPLLFVRIIMVWYTSQLICIKWGSCLSDPFSVHNGVRQGGILSPRLFNLYISLVPFLKKGPKN